MGEIIYKHKILVEELKGKRALGRSKHKGKDNVARDREE
jgi:hypothetical protein